MRCVSSIFFFILKENKKKHKTMFFSISGCLIEGPNAPDVPPRNPTMSRMNGRVQGIVNDLDMDFEPSCLVRTPSGNVYIPSGNLSKSKKSIAGCGKKNSSLRLIKVVI